MYKAAYEHNLHKVFYLPYKNRESDISTNEDHWPKQLLDEIIWFHFQGILEQADFHANGEKIILH